MFDQIKNGVRFYLQHFGTLALVGLPIYIPTNVFRLYLVTALKAEDGTDKLVQTYDMALAGFEIGVIIATLNQIASGKPVRFFDVVTIAAKRYLPLAVTLLIAVIICGLGALACAIPGIICLVRYALLDSIVVLEKLSFTTALRRSWQLTSGCAWWILLVQCVFHSSIFVLAWVPTFASHYLTLSQEAWLIIAFVQECMIDLIAPVQAAIMFSFYLHARGAESPIDAPASSFNDDLLEHEIDSFDEDDNPYRAPQTT